MDEDLTASHWDDVLPTSQSNSGVSKIGSIFDTLDLDDPHRDPTVHTAGFSNAAQTDESEDDNEAQNEEETEPITNDFDSPFQGSGTLHQAEIDQLNAIKKQERETHKSSLLQELAGGEEPEIAEITATPVKFTPSESLFEDKGSPLKVQSLSSPAPEASATTVTSPLKSNLLKSGQFKARGRKISSKSVAKHLAEASGGLDPLSSSAVAPTTSSDPAPSISGKSQTLLREVDSPLYDLPKTAENAPEEALVQNQGSGSHNATEKPPPKKDSNDLDISLGDPVKVGDITTAHIVYGISTTNKNPESAHFPPATDPVLVSRRYRDFRWIYHQLQSNHPGMIIPPPPSKQTYIGRFNENFVENRRQSLEKMLVKISRVPALANDGDFVLFLTSQNFAQDSKDREQVSGSGASIQANNGDDESDRGTGTGSIVSGTGAGGFMSSLFSIATNLPEPDDFFAKKKGYIEDLEHNLKTFYKSLELIASQRIEISAVIGEISSVVDEIAELEISKTTSELLAAFAEVQAKLKENLDRVNLQDQLTLGFTIEEYLRIIGSVKYTFETRSKVYQLYQSFKQDLAKKQESLDRLNSRYKSSVDKINQVSFEVDKLQQKVAHYEHSFETISHTIKCELQNFEAEKIKDFRNSVEIFIESSIESQKEAIELWETFYERNKLVLV